MLAGAAGGVAHALVVGKEVLGALLGEFLQALLAGGLGDEVKRGLYFSVYDGVAQRAGRRGAVEQGGGAAIGKPADSAAAVLDGAGRMASISLLSQVMRSRVSPMTFSLRMSTPNSVLATLATAFSSPSLDMVAEVPMHTSFSARRRSRRRRTSSATSAPWRPRCLSRCRW